MAREDVLEALWRVLAGRIYPQSPKLMRNDAKAAKLVFDYIHKMRQASDSIRQSRRWSPQNIELLAQYDRVKVLASISEMTMRKYVGQLWKQGLFDDCIFFEEVDD